METEPTVFIVDDDAEVRKSLLMLLKSMQIKAKAFAAPSEFLDDYDPEQPGCLVLDVRMPEMSGLELQKRLGEQEYVPPIIILTGYADVPLAVKAMEAQAFTFLEKPVNEDELLDYINRAFKQDASARQEWIWRRECEKKFSQLTEREKEIVKWVESGYSNKMIAHELGISIKTVDFHRGNIKRKLQVESLAELLQMVRETNHAAHSHRE